MNIDVESLRTFSRLARSGTEKAAGSLAQMTGMEARVDVTKVDLRTREDVEREFRTNDRVSVEIGFEGGLTGRTMLAFERECADQIVSTLLPDGAGSDDEFVRSGLKEVGNIMIGGFIDGWADYLGTTIDFSTPTYVEVDDEEPLTTDDETLVDDHVLVFRNRLEADGAAEEFYLYMLPTRESVATIGEATEAESDPVPMESFAIFERMIADGAEQASEDVTTMTGIQTAVEVSRLSFVPVEGVPATVPDEPRIGVVLEFEGTPEGYLVVLFDEASATNLADALMPGAGDDEAMRQSAIQEIGNIITSGFIDGWANTLETTIDITPPEFVHDLGPAILDPPTSELARNQEHAFLIDSTIRTEDDAFTCELYALPDEDELRRALTQLPAQS